MHLLDINEMTEDQISEIFDRADNLQSNQHSNILCEKTFVLFFPETSIRTRMTFERAIKDLGGNCVLFPPEALDARERSEDRIRYIENWADGMVIRHPDFSKIQEISKHSSIPIINAMTAKNHPCEIISDLYSVRNIRNNYRNLVYTFVGPAGNISRSWAAIARVMNLHFNHVCLAGNELSEDNRNYRFYTDLESVMAESDVILTDSLPAGYRNADYINKYQITLGRMKLTKENAILNPCPPFFRDEEVSDEVISSDYFVGYGFKKNLLYVQQAILLKCCGILI